MIRRSWHPGFTPSHTKPSVSGFTLIETLVALAILTLAIAGPLVAASRALNAAAIARDELAASYLAQEGIEYVRLMRDQAYLATRSSDAAWTRFLVGGAAESVAACRTSGCTLDPTRPMGTGSTRALSPCSGSACGPLYVANGVYTEQSGIPGSSKTSFVRTIRIEDISGTTDAPGVPYPEKQVVSTVSWSFHNTSYTISVIDILTPWQ